MKISKGGVGHSDARLRADHLCPHDTRCSATAGRAFLFFSAAEVCHVSYCDLSGQSLAELMVVREAGTGETALAGKEVESRTNCIQMDSELTCGLLSQCVPSQPSILQVWPVRGNLL